MKQMKVSIVQQILELTNSTFNKSSIEDKEKVGLSNTSYHAFQAWKSRFVQKLVSVVFLEYIFLTEMWIYWETSIRKAAMSSQIKNFTSSTFCFMKGNISKLHKLLRGQSIEPSILKMCFIGNINPKKLINATYCWEHSTAQWAPKLDGCSGYRKL